MRYPWGSGECSSFSRARFGSLFRSRCTSLHLCGQLIKEMTVCQLTFEHLILFRLGLEVVVARGAFDIQSRFYVLQLFEMDLVILFLPFGTEKFAGLGLSSVHFLSYASSSFVFLLIFDSFLTLTKIEFVNKEAPSLLLNYQRGFRENCQFLICLSCLYRIISKWKFRRSYGVLVFIH